MNNFFSGLEFKDIFGIITAIFSYSSAENNIFINLLKTIKKLIN